MKKLYKLIFLRKFNEQLNIVKSIELTYLNQSFRYEKSTYTIDLNNVCYINKTQKIYFIDIDSGNQYSFQIIKSEMNPKQLDTLMSTKIIKELASGIIDNRKEKITLIIIGFIIGILLGLLIMQWLDSAKIEDLLTQINNSNEVIVPFKNLLNLQNLRSILL